MAMRVIRRCHLYLVGLVLALSVTEGLAQSSMDVKMRAYGLVDISEVDSTIMVDLMYSRSDNFMQADVYGDFVTAYLAPDFAAKIARAQQILREERGDRYSIIIYDAARPLSVQQRMWDLVKDTPSKVYVAPVSKRGGGRHNYGVAVDMSLYDRESGQPLDMGSPVDHFGIRAHINNEASLVKQGLITREAMKNRQYLFHLMDRVGLRPIRKEWWHFQERNSIREVREQNRLLDF